MILIALTCVFAVFGVVLVAGGGWLIALGDSAFYALTGASFLLTAWLLYRRRASALLLHGAFTLVAMGWAIWEVGFDWWQLVPRGGVIAALAMFLCLPAVRRPLKAPLLPIGAATMAAIVLAVYSMFQDPSDIEGQLPQQRLAGMPATGNAIPDGEWHQYGRTNYGQRWSPLDQITPSNVAQLKPAWQYRTGDVRRPGDVKEVTYEVTPLKVGSSLYLCTPHNLAIAIDAGTGREKWRYDPGQGLNISRDHQTCRGVTYWEAAAAPAGTTPQEVALRQQAAQECPRRIYLPTSDARLIALNADTGELCRSFGQGGALHLEQGMLHNPSGYYEFTSPPVAVLGRLIIGGAVNDNASTKEQSGVIRAFDVDSGELLWNWDSANPERTTPIDIAKGETYVTNSPDSWSVSSVDEELGLVYLPMGNRMPDQLGMGRNAAVEENSSSIVALDIRTGRRQWVRQFVHHDLWDEDVPAQPVLVNLTRGDRVIPALIGSTKQGDIWVLDRRTGEPLSPREELPAPSGAIAEDSTSPTQPISKLTFRPPALTGRDMWGTTMFDQLYCRIQFHRLNYRGQYTPPSVGGTLVYPGNAGVFNWGSIAVDPERQVMFGMPTYLPYTYYLVPAAKIPPKNPGEPNNEQGLNRNDGAPYGIVIRPFLSPLGIPCNAPPWGYVAGADLTGERVDWRHRNGTVRDLTPLPLPFKLGVPGLGGPMITRGGVVFLGATVDDYLRAYDLTTGRQLWSQRLPAGGQSTPMTYLQDGKQYVVIVAGGHGLLGTKGGDYIEAFTLP